LFHTIDGGQNWSESSIPCPNINAIGFASLDVGWAVGYNGSILKTNTGGMTYIEDKHAKLVSNPNNFNLYQNYPNPFNPSTTIEFTLPNSESTTLKVYDILGKEVATLVSQKLNQGNHTYTFEGKNLASGVYYYRLEAGNFVQTHKMIYLK
jgi:hypothetical protein